MKSLKGEVLGKESTHIRSNTRIHLGRPHRLGTIGGERTGLPTAGSQIDCRHSGARHPGAIGKVSGLATSPVCRLHGQIGAK
jgi:hypothetical protein